MTAIQFYEDLDSAAPGGYQQGGLVLMYNNGGTWHLCKKHAARVGFSCGSSSPPKPQSGGAPPSDDWATKRFVDNAELVEPVEAVTKDHLCRNCLSFIEGRLDVSRVVIGVEEASEKEDIKRFVEQRNETLK